MLALLQAVKALHEEQVLQTAAGVCNKLVSGEMLLKVSMYVWIAVEADSAQFLLKESSVCMGHTPDMPEAAELKAPAKSAWPAV